VVTLEIKKEDIEKRYRNLSDEELIKIKETGFLSDMAFLVLNDELSRRGITADKIRKIQKEKKFFANKNDALTKDKILQDESAADKMLINKKQRKILLICVFAIIVMLLFPPFHLQYRDGAVFNKGYNFLFSPPDPRATVNVSTLLIQFLAVALIGGILFLAFKEK
jgi:uncharacterized ion transporter superfamily protein YfcC